MFSGISAEALAKLLLIQSMANQLPCERAILDFVSRGLADMPGVENVVWEKEELRDRLSPEGRLHRIPVQLEGRTFAEFVLTIEDEESFLPYLPYIQNLCFTVAAISEEKRLRREKERYFHELEDRVQERTRQLTEEVRERDAAEKLAIAEKRRAERYLEVAGAITLELDMQGRIETINTWGAQVLGYSPQELCGRSWFEMAVPPENRKSVQDAFQKITSGNLDGFEYAEREILTRQGERRLIAWHNALRRSSTGDIEGTLSFGSDITERREAARILETKQKDLDHAQAVAHIGNWRLDLVHNELFWSDETYRIFGVQKGTALSYELFMAFVHPEDRNYVDTQWAAAMKGKPYDIDHRIIVDGTVKWVREKAELELDPQGNLRGGFGTVQDITDRKQLEIDLHSSMQAAEAASRAKSEFLANMSHELRTPLTVIMGTLGLLGGEVKDSEHRQFLEMADDAAQRLLGMITELLDFSSVDAGTLKIEERPFGLRGSIQRTLSHFALSAQEKGIDLDLCVHPDLPERLLGDPGRLEQVLKNLVGNALKFTEQGTIDVRVTRCHQNLLFRVTDTGIGIPPEKIQVIFDPFTQVDGSMTRPYGGTGLGLAISKELIELMGGKISAESQVGRGSTFSFTLPLKEVHEEAEPAVPEDESPETIRILLAEDDPMIRELIAEVLLRRGYSVAVAEDGQEALTLWREGNYGLILMDLQMPRMNGFETAKKIRERERGQEKRICIFALTAHARAEEKEEYLNAGMDGVLTKPFQIEELDTLVRRCHCGKAPPLETTAPSQ